MKKTVRLHQMREHLTKPPPADQPAFSQGTDTAHSAAKAIMLVIKWEIIKIYLEISRLLKQHQL